ncbi:MAG TPA: glycosyltransferase family 4 protein, partial [Verrucomicrobiae bacterium]|nr:glycosyltransferase family 4 protein [Verrucomicrobiae bacterium]
MNSSTAQGIPFGNALPRADADQRARVAKPAGLDDVAESRVAVLTAGRDKHYAHDLAEALADAGESFDFICGNELDVPDLRQNPQINLLNLRGDQRVNASFKVKMKRVLLYYWRLIRYAATAQPKIFHILWNNKFEWFDRTLLMLFYRAMGKKIAFTAHNVNAGERDANDSFFNRLTLRIQYRLCDHIFVHTEKMKGELAEQFKVPPAKVSVIPYGINQTVPTTALTRAAARQRLGLAPAD